MHKNKHWYSLYGRWVSIKMLSSLVDRSEAHWLLSSTRMFYLLMSGHNTASASYKETNAFRRLLFPLRIFYAILRLNPSRMILHHAWLDELLHSTLFIGIKNFWFFSPFHIFTARNPSQNLIYFLKSVGWMRVCWFTWFNRIINFLTLNIIELLTIVLFRGVRRQAPIEIFCQLWRHFQPLFITKIPNLFGKSGRR